MSSPKMDTVNVFYIPPEILTAEPKQLSSNTIFLRTYFNVGYTLFLTPHKFIPDSKNITGIKFKYVSSWFHKLITGIIHLLILNHYFNLWPRYLFATKPNVNSSVPAVTFYFRVIAAGTSAFYIGVHTFSMWQRQHLFLALLDQINCKHKDVISDEHKRSHCLLKILQYGMFAAYFSLAITCVLAGFETLEQGETWSWENILKKHNQLCRFSLFMDSNLKEVSDFMPVDYILTGLRLITDIFLELYSAFCDFGTLTFAITFKCLVNDFIAGMEQKKELFLVKYEALKETTDALNNAIGLIMVGMLSDMLTYYATNVLDITGTHNWIGSLRYGCYIVGGVFCFLIPASATAKV